MPTLPETPPAPVILSSSVVVSRLILSLHPTPLAPAPPLKESQEGCQCAVVPLQRGFPIGAKVNKRPDLKGGYDSSINFLSTSLFLSLSPRCFRPGSFSPPTPHTSHPLKSRS
jgi:hypothetical protein